MSKLSNKSKSAFDIEPVEEPEEDQGPKNPYFSPDEEGDTEYPDGEIDQASDPEAVGEFNASFNEDVAYK